MSIEEVTMLKNKSQAALEFLMTYGWALLVALVAIAALMYWGVVDFNFLPDICVLGVGFNCLSPVFQYSGTTGVISFKVANQIGKDLSDFYVVVDPDNPYCGGWFGFIANFIFPSDVDIFTFNN